LVAFTSVAEAIGAPFRSGASATTLGPACSGGQGRRSPDVDEDDEDADLRPGPHETTEDIVAFYRRARTAADRVIEDNDLDELGRAWFGDEVSLRWVLIHMIEETARHAGHMDIVRELIDGTTGDHPRDG